MKNTPQQGDRPYYAITLDDTNIVFGIQTVTAAISIPLGSFLMKYLSVKWCIFLGGVF